MARKVLISRSPLEFKPKWGKYLFNNACNSEVDENTGLVSKKFRTEMVKRLKKQGIDDKVVLSAMMDIKRHNFVESALSSRAYEDSALPIGYKQTISQPYVVARVTSLIRELTCLVDYDDPKKGKVLEIGTGCGYQAAVMSKCFGNVCSIERISGLYDESKKRLRLEDTNINIRFGDGLQGWPEKAPFDAIVFSGSLKTIPIHLMSQIKIYGVLIAPVGKTSQNLVALVKTGKKDSDMKKHIFDYVKYVPILNGVEK